MATGRIPTTANSPLTAKGDLFTFSTGSAKLAVGNNGETLVADSSTSTGLSYQANWAAGINKIINGDFRINQRSFVSFNPSSAGVDQYNFDRFFTNTVGGTATVSPQTFTAGTAPVAGYEGTNFLRCVTTSQSAAGDYFYFGQKIEDVRTYANQTVTVSFWAKASTGTPTVGIALVQNFGSGGGFASTLPNIPGISSFMPQGFPAGGATGVSIGSTPPSVAGRWFDPERAKQYKDIFGDSGPLIGFLEQRTAYEQDPQRLKEKLDILGPYQKDVAQTNQKLGLQSLMAGTLFKGIPDTIKEYNMAQVYGLANQTNNLAAYQTDRNPSAYSGLRYRIGGGSR